MKRRWRAYVVDAAPADEVTDGLAARLTVRIACDPKTPVSQFGREVVVELTMPMLEILALLAEDVGAVYHVTVEDPLGCDS